MNSLSIVLFIKKLLPSGLISTVLLKEKTILYCFILYHEHIPARGFEPLMLVSKTNALPLGYAGNLARNNTCYITKYYVYIYMLYQKY